jgi:hypothetical protein
MKKYLSIENRKIIEKYITEFKLQNYFEEIISSSYDVINMWINQSTNDSLIKKGETKLGGLPHLPNGINWPVNNEFDPEYSPNPFLEFVGQLNFKDIKPFDINNLLPNTGILYIFYNAYNEENMEFIYLDDINESNLNIIPFPEKFNEDFSTSNVYNFKFNNGIMTDNSIPVETYYIGAKQPSTEEYENYDKFIHDLHNNKLLSRFLILGTEDNFANEEDNLELPLLEIPTIPKLNLNWFGDHEYKMRFTINETDLKNKNFTTLVGYSNEQHMWFENENNYWKK